MKIKAFTLIELVMVIAIIGVLSAIAIPLYTDYTKKSRCAEVPSNLASITRIQNVYKADISRGNGTFAPDISTLGWILSSGNNYTEFFTYATDGAKSGCTSETVGFATAKSKNQTLTEWKGACMTTALKLTPYY